MIGRGGCRHPQPPSALNPAYEALHGELARIWRESDVDPAVQAVVVTGSGKAFFAGGDLDLLDRMDRDTDLRDAIMTEMAQIVRAMTSVRAPIIAAVNGPAVGLRMQPRGYERPGHRGPGSPIRAWRSGSSLAMVGGLAWPFLTSPLGTTEFIPLGDRPPAADAPQTGLANRVVPPARR